MRLAPWLAAGVVAATAGMASAGAPLALAVSIGALGTAFAIAIGLKSPQWMVVGVIALSASYVPDAVAVHTPLLGVRAIFVLPVLFLALRRLMGHPLPEFPIEAVPFVPFLLVLATSGVFADEEGDSLRVIVQTIELLILVTVMLMLLTRPRWLRRAAWGVVLAAAGLGALAILQQATRTYAFDYLGLSTVLEDRGTMRAAGPMDPNFFAQFLLSAGALCAYLFLAERSRLVRVAALTLLVTLLLASALTYSRGGTIALVVGLTAIVLLRRPPTVVVGVGLAVVLAIGAFAMPSAIADRLLWLVSAPTTGLSSASDESIAGRYEVNAVAVAMFVDHPVLGVGPGNYPDRYLETALPLGRDHQLIGGVAAADQQRPHSLYLELLAETGLVGTVAFIGVIGIAAHGAWQARRRLPRADALLAEGILVALIVFLTAALFLHGAYPRYLWIFVGLALVCRRLSTADAARLSGGQGREHHHPGAGDSGRRSTRSQR